MSEFNPWPSYQPTPEEWAARRCAELLAACERAWRTGLQLAVADAVEICRSYRQPPPDWLADAVASIVTSQMSALDRKRRRADLVHHVRWDAVTELRERRFDLLALSRAVPRPLPSVRFADHARGLTPTPVRFVDDVRGLTWEAVFEAVSEELRGTEARGSARVIKASYQLVQREIRAGRGARFMLTANKA